MTKDNCYVLDTDEDGIVDTVKPVDVLSGREVPVTSVALDQSSLDLVVGDSAVLQAEISPVNARSHDTTSQQGSEPGAVHADQITAMRITGISHSIAAGRKIKLVLEMVPKNTGTDRVKWTSSNSAYAVVSSKGVVTTKKRGIGKTVIIHATTVDGSGITVNYKIKILKHAVKKIRCMTKERTVRCGKKLKLKTRVLTTGKTANTRLKWTSSDIRYATVTGKGVVIAKRAGKSSGVMSRDK